MNHKLKLAMAKVQDIKRDLGRPTNSSAEIRNLRDRLSAAKAEVRKLCTRQELKALLAPNCPATTLGVGE